jgi:serine/threonine protein kinase
MQKASTQTGTHGYMSPEIYFKNNYNSDKCDYWSLGMLFYEIFEGVRV